MPQASILLIDDDQEYRVALAERLETRGLRVTQAGSGHEALDVIEEHDFDAVVLDMMLPGMDGIEALRKLRARRPHLQVVLLTGHASITKSVEAMRLGAVDFMEKPPDMAALMRRIEEASERRLMLVEKEGEETIRKILAEKGW